MTTFRRRGRIDRSRLARARTDRTQDEWAEDLSDGVDFEVEELHVDKPRKRSKGIYLLPNAFTTAALFCGFFAISTLAIGLRLVSVMVLFALAPVSMYICH